MLIRNAMSDVRWMAIEFDEAASGICMRWSRVMVGGEEAWP